jgi:enoyl-CoA hydratase/carnithine racemase
MKTFETILYETPAEHVARVVLNRPETRNAQDTRLLYELNEAFDVAAQDDQVFTSDWLSAEEAKSLGMVNQIVPRDTLEAAALAMAQKIAKKSLFALKLTKEAVNVAEDAQGRPQAMQTSFALHQLAHTHWLKLYDMLIDPTGLPPETAKALGARLKK